MTQEKFHAFVRLVRKAHRTLHEAKTGNNGNSWPQYFALCSRIDSSLHEFTEITSIYYEWQVGFINQIRLVRKQRKEYEVGKHTAQLERLKESEDKLTYGLGYIEKKFPQVFISETSKQEALF